MNSRVVWKSFQLLVLALAGQSAAASLPRWATVIQRDVFDVATYASLGDSFASGPSAGDNWDNVKACRRYTQAFGPQVSRANEIHGPKPMKFSFIACSGSRTKHIYEGRGQASGNGQNGKSVGGSASGGSGGGKPTDSQAAPLRDLHPDMVTLSIGGNDVGFVTLLDRCVYRFYDVKGCAGCTPSVFFDDCTNDCQAAIDEVSANIASDDFTNGLKSAIKAIFDSAQRTRLFITGYPAFWNDRTDACDRVSFKFGCINNSVLPLIKDRRRKMNGLTAQLNNKIQNIINQYRAPSGSSISFVDTNPFFEGHRFCEEGVSEPSYRNPNIWFYPFEYWTGGTLNFDGKAVPSGDCRAIYNNGGDAGDYYGCELANAVLGGATIDLSKQSNNVNGGGDVDLSSSGGSSGSGSLPDFLARIFHPTINGHTAYKNAIVSAYQNAPAPASQTAAPQPNPPPNAPFPPPPPVPPAYVPGVCSFHLKETETCEDDSKNLYATIKLLDNDKNVIGGTGNENDGKGPGINSNAPLSLKSKLPLTLVVTGEHQGDYIQFAYSSVSWTSNTKTGAAQCTLGGWDPRQDVCLGLLGGPDRNRQMDCSFPC